jgi:hypothetical protein
MKPFHLALAVALGVAGCASAPAPTARMASSQATIRAAEAVGAERVPRAALHLKYARDQVAEAQTLIRADENERAAAVLQRAEADAELALALTKEAQMRGEAQRAVAEASAARQSTRP